MTNLEKSIQNWESDKTYPRRPWIAVLVFVFACFTDTVLFGTNSIYNFVSFQRYAVIVIALLLLLVTFRIKPYNREMSIRNLGVILSIGMIFITMVLIGNAFHRYYHMTVIACLIIAVSFSKLCSLEEFAYRFIKIMTFIAAFSLVVYIFRDQLVNMNFPILTNSTGYRYKTLIFSNISIAYNNRIRNEGPYWEAGTYQAYLNVAMIMTLFFDRSKFKIHRALLFAVTLITTLSGAALYPLVFTLSAFILNVDANTEGNEKHNSNLKFIIVIAAIIVGGIASESGYIDAMVSKVTMGTESSSFSYRWASFYSDITSFLKSPIIGTEPSVLDARRNALGLSLGVRNVGVTNTIAAWFAYFGFSVGLLLVTSYWKLSKKIGKSYISRVLLFASFIAMTSNENLSSSPLFIVLPFLLREQDFNLME